MDTKRGVIGIYHKDCIDGTTAAAVLLKKFSRIELFPLAHEFTPEELQPILETIKPGDSIYTVDYGPVKEFLDAGYDVTTIDHHIGAKTLFEDFVKEYPNYTYIFDNEKSGTSLAWSYFFPNEPEPQLVKYVEDLDLWRWRYGDETKHVNNYLSMFINQPDGILAFLEADVAPIMAEGKIISQYADFNIKKITERAKPIKLKIGEHTVPAYNVDLYQSEVGNNLAKQTGGAVALFTIRGNKVLLSFRLEDENIPTALDLAMILGGGGHKCASGAEISLKDFLRMIV